MALIRNLILGGTNEQYLGDTSVTGAVNIRASHSMMCRIKHSSTSTSGDIWPVVYSNSAATTGSTIARSSASGVGSTSISAQRASTTPTFNKVDASGTYGDTTTWRHHAFVYDATAATITHYVDGTSVGSVSSSTTLVSSATGCFYIGILRGKLADVAYFSRALTATEVSDMANYRQPQVTSGLIGFYRLDSNANDTSGQANNLSVFGSGTAPSYSTADNPPQPETPAVSVDGDVTSASTLAAQITMRVAGTAASASSLSSTVSIRNNLASTVTSATTLGAWIRPRWGRRFENSGEVYRGVAGAFPLNQPWTIAAWQKIVDPITSGASGFSLALSTGAGLQVGCGWDVSGSQREITFFRTGTTFAFNCDSGWHHVAMTFDGTNILRYIDGAQAGASLSGASLTGDVGLVEIVSGGATSLHETAHAKIWIGAALTVAEIAAEATYYTPFNKLPQLFAWWQLGWPNVTLDSSGNGNTLTDSGSTEAQNESPGLPMALVSSTSTSASTFAATLGIAVTITATATSASTFSGAALALLQGASTSASTLSGTAQTPVALASTAQSASTLFGSLIQAQPLAATYTSASTLSASALALLTATGSSASTLSGSLGTFLPIAATSTSASTLSATIGVQGQYAGTAFSASTFSALLSATRELAGSISSASTAAGSLGTLFPLTATSTSASEFTGTVTNALAAAGTASTASTLSATASLSTALASTGTSASTLTGSLTALLVGSSSSASTLVLLANSTSGASTSASTLSGTISNFVVRPLAATSGSASTLLGALSVVHIASADGGTFTNANAAVFHSLVLPPSMPKPRPWPPRYG